MGSSPNSPLSVFLLLPLRALPSRLVTGAFLSAQGARTFQHLGLARQAIWLTASGFKSEVQRRYDESVAVS